MPSIRDLFGAPPDAEGGEANFDLDEFFKEAESIIASRPDPAGQAEAANPEAPEPVAPVEPVAETPAPEPEPEVEPPLPPAAVSDPFAEIPAERRAAMLALDQVLTSDPAKRDAIFRAMNGVEAAPQVAVEPQLPDDIDPNSFEARIWRENQDTRRAVQEMSSRLQEQQVSQQQQRAANEAQAAARAFGAKYPQLEEHEVFEIARFAGNSGVAGAFVEADRSNPQAALERSFESVLFANPDFRSRVIEAPAPVIPGEQPEAVDRKRKLTALSSAASPVATGPARRKELETRPDGRLTPESRAQAVKEVTAGLLRQRQGL